jgi:hypothetical protein
MASKDGLIEQKAEYYKTEDSNPDRDRDSQKSPRPQNEEISCGN